MPKARIKQIKCSKCGATWKPNEINPIKTWHLIAPFPDKNGKITVTVMAVWRCPKCGASVRGVYSKIKIGADADIKSKNRTKMLIEILNSSSVVSLDQLANEFKVDINTIKKAVEYLIKTRKIKGIIEGNVFKKLS